MRQKTLRKNYTFEGKGLHTGCPVRMTLCPAPENTGIVFVRTDLEGAPGVAALAENVSSTARSTTISDGAASVTTIEHVLSALTGLGVDNARIEINNVEVPILDGSAAPYCQAIQPDGLQEQEAERVYLQLKETLEYRDEAKGILLRIEPAGTPSYNVTVDFNSRVVGVQKASWTPQTDYAREIAPCRTFVFFHELEYLYKNNLIKGGDVDNAIVIVEHPVDRSQLEHLAGLFGVPMLEVTPGGYLSNLQLHYPNECARHKTLDLLGDLRLCGGFLQARVTAVRTGHAVNTRAAKMFREALLK